MKLIIDIRAEWEMRGLVGFTLSKVYTTNTHIRDGSLQSLVQSCNQICNLMHRTRTTSLMCSYNDACQMCKPVTEKDKCTNAIIKLEFQNKVGSAVTWIFAVDHLCGAEF